ncbi:MAG: hypothetical protein KAR42_16765 [candidate division Zixibacteria bacterium]|nr:hypothetical protein [candidate division Zixibacteria bacterium]
MTLEITGIDEVRWQLRRVNQLLDSNKPMENICKDVEERILKRTDAGRDYKNMSFAPYSTKYAKKKGVGTGSVNLRLTGTMLGAIETKVFNPNHGQVLITSRAMAGTSAKSDMIAQIHTTGTGKQPKREFMNITKTALQESVNKHYDDEIMRILGRR